MKEDEFIYIITKMHEYIRDFIDHNVDEAIIKKLDKILLKTYGAFFRHESIAPYCAEFNYILKFKAIDIPKET